MSDSTTTSTPNSDPPAIKDAGAPFDNSHADVFLRSSDNVDFRVFKVLLSIASSVFRDMFTLPQPPGGTNGDGTKDGLPIVQMAEGSKTLQALLTMCYPMTLVNPLVAMPEELEDVMLVFDAGVKYDIATVVERCRAWFVAPIFLETSPVMAYAISCRWNWEKEAKMAARSTIGHAILEKPLEKELDIMSTREFRALLLYIERCTAAMRKVPTECKFGYGWGSAFGLECESCGDLNFGGSRVPKIKWLKYYLQGVTEAVINGAWNTTENRRLMDAAVREAGWCLGCSSQAATKVKQLYGLVQHGMNEAISEIVLDFPV